jgi:hypothetical protein
MLQKKKKKKGNMGLCRERERERGVEQRVESKERERDLAEVACKGGRADCIGSLLERGFSGTYFPKVWKLTCMGCLYLCL